MICLGLFGTTENLFSMNSRTLLQIYRAFSAEMEGSAAAMQGFFADIQQINRIVGAR